MQDDSFMSLTYALITIGLASVGRGCRQLTLRWVIIRVGTFIALWFRWASNSMWVLRRQLRHVMPPMRLSRLTLEKCCLTGTWTGGMLAVG